MACEGHRSGLVIASFYPVEQQETPILFGLYYFDSYRDLIVAHGDIEKHVYSWRRPVNSENKLANFIYSTSRTVMSANRPYLIVDYKGYSLTGLRRSTAINFGRVQYEDSSEYDPNTYWVDISESEEAEFRSQSELFVFHLAGIEPTKPEFDMINWRISLNDIKFLVKAVSSPETA